MKLGDCYICGETTSVSKIITLDNGKDVELCFKCQTKIGVKP